MRKKIYLALAGTALALVMALGALWSASAHGGWPPLKANLSIQRDGNIDTATIWVENLSDDDTGVVDIRAQVPQGATLLESWAGGRGTNQGVFNGREVAWTHDDGVTAQESHGPFVYRFDISGVDPNANPTIIAWIKWNGGDGGESGSTVSQAVDVRQSTPLAPVGEPGRGSAVYAQNCQECHGVGATGGDGPALTGKQFLMDHGLLDSFSPDVRNGRGGVMPAFSSAQINDQQLADLYAYIRGLSAGTAAPSGTASTAAGMTSEVPASPPVSAPVTMHVGNVAQGRVLYSQNCQACHGADGAGGMRFGDATAADVRWAALSDMYEGKGDLVTLAKRAILTGKDEDGEDLDASMPRWEGKLTDAQVADIIAFLQTLGGGAAPMGTSNAGD